MAAEEESPLSANKPPSVTLAAYAAADRFGAALGRPAYANPVLFAAAILAAVLLATGTTYETFFAGAQFVHFLLGPATVALAVPLYRNLPKVRSPLVPMLAALFCGSLTAIISAVAIAAALGARRAIPASLAPKLVTAPIAMSLAEQNGGIPTLTAALVIATGIFGAVTVTPLMNALGV
jgi:putative effector of murein hydrolase